ncbi:vanadium-dependent haloperoxidase [Runella sp.]|uniref:vanadium-dependent haloperoxidase n=1 Tax=Runella sp. TaxID=1960881 RepID=UPI003D0C2B2A
MKKLLYFVFSVLFIIGCTNVGVEPTKSNDVANYSADFLREWFKLECRIVKETAGFLPPQASRAFGYVGVTAYEAVYTGISDAKPLAGQLNKLIPASMPVPLTKSLDYHWGIVANAAVADMMRYMFDKNLSPANLQKINDLEAKYAAEFGETLNKATAKTLAEESIKHGKAVALAIYEYSKTDGGHESYLNPFSRPFTPVTGVDKWVPTDAKNATPLSPYWYKCRLALTSNAAFMTPDKPIAFSIEKQSVFYQQALKVYNQVKGNTAEQVEITKFWADDPFATCTPTGHTFNIMTQLLEETNATLAKAVVGYAMLGIGEIDAFIACWKAKYDYSLIRPVSYIQKYIDPAFTTVIGTPAFPAYTSGHATEVGVGERIFTSLFTKGDGAYVLTDRSQVQHGFAPRKFTNFADMALECANSRLYGGIHYDMDNINGLKMGRSIGDNVVKSIQWPSLSTLK